jgi:hypothetical protein
MSNFAIRKESHPNGENMPIQDTPEIALLLLAFAGFAVYGAIDYILESVRIFRSSYRRWRRAKEEKDN